MQTQGKLSRQPKGPFQDMCHALRTARRLKLREVAEAIGVTTSCYGNVESSRFRVISDERVMKLADFFKLGPVERRKLLDLAAALPLSEYTVDQRERWAKRNEQRSKSRRFELMFAALDDLVCMLAAESAPCTCAPAVAEDFDTPAREAIVCPLCKAMQAMGIPEGYSTPDLAMSRLAAFHAKREAKKS